MALSNKFFNKQFVQTALAIAASVLAVAGFVYGATTIGTNISVDGNLTVSGTSATSTFSTGGLAVGTNQFVVQQTNGNIGIGTTSPGTLLGVQGDIVGAGRLTVSSFAATSTTATSTFPTGGLTVGTNQFVVQQTNGNVGIGTTDPIGLLNVHATVADPVTWITRGDNVPGNTVTLRLGNNDATYRNSSAYIQAIEVTGINTYHLAFGTQGSGGASPAVERMRIDQKGNVGIATTSPAQLLSVAGDAYIAGTGTTTLNLKTTTASKGTCIEMFASDGTVRRVYINAVDNTFKIEAGTCK